MTSLRRAIGGKAVAGALACASAAAGCLIATSLLAPAISAAAGIAGSASQAEVTTVHNLRHCLVKIPATERDVLVFRLGVGGGPKLTVAQTAARLGLPAATVSADEQSAVSGLQSAYQNGQCVRSPAAAIKSTVAPAVVAAHPTTKVAKTNSPLPSTTFHAFTPDTGTTAPPRWTNPVVLAPLLLALLFFFGVVMVVRRTVRHD